MLKKNTKSIKFVKKNAKKVKITKNGLKKKTLKENWIAQHFLYNQNFLQIWIVHNYPLYDTDNQKSMYNQKGMYNWKEYQWK